MAKIQGLKRLYKEDFPPENADLIERIGYSFNVFAEEVIQAFNKKISYENLNRELKVVKVTVDASGNPTDTLSIAGTNIVNGIAGLQIIRAAATNGTSLVNSQPFATYSIGTTGQINISNIKGLPASTEFSLTIEIIGN